MTTRLMTFANELKISLRADLYRILLVPNSMSRVALSCVVSSVAWCCRASCRMSHWVPCVALKSRPYSALIGFRRFKKLIYRIWLLMGLFIVSHIFSPLTVRNSLGQWGSFTPGVRWIGSSLVPVWSILFATFFLNCLGRGATPWQNHCYLQGGLRGWEENGILELEYIILNIFLTRIKETKGNDFIYHISYFVCVVLCIPVHYVSLYFTCAVSHSRLF